LAPLWARQVPYTIMKFVAFERIVETFYKKLLTKPKNEYSKATQLSVTFASGYLAGILCAIISHPADTMVSKLNNMKTSGSLGSNISKIYSEIGMAGLWRGLGTRILMVGTLTGLQWWIYDTFKTLTGLQTTGGAPVAAKKWGTEGNWKHKYKMIIWHLYILWMLLFVVIQVKHFINKHIHQ